MGRSQQQRLAATLPEWYLLSFLVSRLLPRRIALLAGLTPLFSPVTPETPTSTCKQQKKKKKKKQHSTCERRLQRKGGCYLDFYLGVILMQRVIDFIALYIHIYYIQGVWYLYGNTEGTCSIAQNVSSRLSIVSNVLIKILIFIEFSVNYFTSYLIMGG